jgi:hypothetical protein
MKNVFNFSIRSQVGHVQGRILRDGSADPERVNIIICQILRLETSDGIQVLWIVSLPPCPNAIDLGVKKEEEGI